MDNSNAHEVQAWLDNWLDGVNFKRPGVDQSLGRDIALKAVELIGDRSLVDRTGFGTAWKPNSDEPTHWTEGPNGEDWGYREWKENNYGTGEPNSRTGQMLSQQSLYGRTTIDEKEVTLIYGTDKPPDRAVFGNPGEELLARDRKVTDVQKAYFAHTGQSKLGIVRPFYQLIDSDAEEIVKLAQENINEYINVTNAANGY